MQVFPHAEARMKLDSLWVEQRARLDRKAKQLDRMPKAWDPAYKRYAIHPTEVAAVPGPSSPRRRK
jgi:hypothetical protein